MLPRAELLKIALAHARAGAKYLRNERGVSVFRLRLRTDLLGLFIPASSYYGTDRVESMTTYGLRDAGVWDEDELRFFNEIDKINALPDEQWVEAIERKIHGERKAEG